MKYMNSLAGSSQRDKRLSQHSIFIYDLEKIVKAVERKVAIFYVNCFSTFRKIEIYSLVSSMDAGVEGMSLPFYLRASDLARIIFVRPESLIKAKAVQEDYIRKILIGRIKALPVPVIPDGHAGGIKSPVYIILDLQMGRIDQGLSGK